MIKFNTFAAALIATTVAMAAFAHTNHDIDESLSDVTVQTSAEREAGVIVGFLFGQRNPSDDAIRIAFSSAVAPTPILFSSEPTGREDHVRRYTPAI